MTVITIGLVAISVLLGALVVYDLTQRRHAILRNFPVVGHLRYILESIGPEIRQYFIASNDEERPFTRDERRWVYASAKKANNYFGFGTDDDLEGSNHHLIIRHAAFPKIEAAKPVAAASPNTGDYGWRARQGEYALASAKVMGEARNRARATILPSVVNISAMSYGSLSAPAVEAMNRGCAIAGAWHNTGEGGVSRHHDHGGELIWQIGTGYFGCRDEQGNFSEKHFLEVCDRFEVRAIEVKLSQGAKPGLGGVLPAAKITPEIASIRGIPMGRNCQSPAGHSAFSNVDEMLDFVERLADATGLPVGIKSAVGERQFWHQLAQAMQSGQRGVDFITVDGGEGGTGAAPLTFSDHVGLPFRSAMNQVHRTFVEHGVDDRVLFIGSGKLGFPEKALLAFALGCDAVSVAREAMLAVGCIQAQVCHSGRCPTGVATQSKWLMRGLDPADKGARCANYLATLRKELLWLSHACGYDHPSQFTLDDFAILDGQMGHTSARATFDSADSTSDLVTTSGLDRA